MLRLLSVLKNGGKVVCYIVFDKETFCVSTMTREEVLNTFDSDNADEKIDNVRLQIYKEQKLIRYDTNKIPVISIGDSLLAAKEAVKAEKEREKAKVKEEKTAEKEKKHIKKIKKLEDKIDVSIEEEKEAVEIVTEEPEEEIVEQKKEVLSAEERDSILKKIAESLNVVCQCKYDIDNGLLIVYEWGAWLTAETPSTRADAMRKAAIELALSSKTEKRKNFEVSVKCCPVHTMIIELIES